MAEPDRASRPRVVIVGGGLAGLAAAVALSESPVEVQLLEARRYLGGRAASFEDPASGMLIDHCQHVGMGCCTTLIDFLHRTGLERHFRQDRHLDAFTREGQRARISATPWLPAPLHLLPAAARIGFLSWKEKLHTARVLWRLARYARPDDIHGPSMQTWLEQQQVSRRLQRIVWQTVLVSALAETLDRISVPAARKVLVDGFMAHRDAFHPWIPLAPLRELFDGPLRQWLGDRGVVRTSQRVRELEFKDGHVERVHLADATPEPVRAVILAVPWKHAATLVPPEVDALHASLQAAKELGSSPITGIHLWLDRPLTDLPHAVLLDTRGHWLFNRGSSLPHEATEVGHYYQIVISASRELAELDRDDLAHDLCEELFRIWPQDPRPRLLNFRVVTEQEAVFSVTPGASQRRPSQQTAIPNLALAGDWTATGWPATMEGAVRSGYRAAQVVLSHLELPATTREVSQRAAWLPRLLLRA